LTKKKLTLIVINMKYRTNKVNFNTKTAVLLVKRDTLRMPWGDIECQFEADFYKTRNGEYFLCGNGGLLTIFRGQNEDKIIPLARDEASKIAKEFMKPDAYKEEFG
jgi:hypothetical protein